MLFKKKHIELILARRKTQTRRLPGKSASYSIGRVYAIRDRWFSKLEIGILRSSMIILVGGLMKEPSKKWERTMLRNRIF